MQENGELGPAKENPTPFRVELPRFSQPLRGLAEITRGTWWMRHENIMGICHTERRYKNNSIIYGFIVFSNERGVVKCQKIEFGFYHYMILYMRIFILRSGWEISMRIRKLCVCYTNTISFPQFVPPSFCKIYRH